MTQVFLAGDEVDGKRLAVFFQHTLGVHLVAGLGKEGAGTIRVELVEWCRRILVTFPQVGVVAVEQEVLVVHVLFVHGFAVQEHVEGAAHADILELRLTQVDGHPLETDRFLVEDTLLHRPTLLQGVKVRLFHPDAAGVNRVGVDVLLLESFESFGLVVHEAVADFFEVVLAAVPVLLEAPPVGAAGKFHIAVFAEGLDLVRARHHREFVADLVEVLPCPGVLREGKHSRGFPEVAPVRLLRCHLDGQAVHDFGAVEAAEPHLEYRRQILFVHDDVVVELHIFGGHRLTVAPLGPRVYMEGKRLAVFTHIPAVGEDSHFPVFGAVQAHERLEHHTHKFGGETVVVFPHVE